MTNLTLRLKVWDSFGWQFWKMRKEIFKLNLWTNPQYAWPGKNEWLKRFSLATVVSNHKFDMVFCKWIWIFLWTLFLSEFLYCFDKTFLWHYLEKKETRLIVAKKMIQNITSAFRWNKFKIDKTNHKWNGWN